MKNRVLIIFTGGTIGCAPEKNGKRALECHNKNASNLHFEDFFLLSNYVHRQTGFYYDNNISFEIKQPINTDSSNMTLEKWTALINCLKFVDLKEFSGVIITHGTDTLAYTAALLSVLFSNITIPIVLVSSNAPLYSPHGNGHKNFEDAMNFIINQRGKICGTFAIFSYDLRRSIVYSGLEIKQSQTYLDRYESLKGEDFGYIEDGIFHINNPESTKMPHRAAINALMEKIGAGGKNLADYIDKLENRVLLIHGYVGLDYSAINIPKSIKAVLHTTYHSSTFCIGDKDDDYNFTVKCLSEKCKGKARLYFAPYAINKYADDTELQALNAGYIQESSIELAYAKLLTAYNAHNSKTIEEGFLLCF